jgi:cell shape-determining protein MreD
MRLIKIILLFLFAIFFQFIFINKINHFQELFLFNPNIFLIIIISLFSLKKYKTFFIFAFLFGLSRDVFLANRFYIFTITYSIIIIFIFMESIFFYKNNFLVRSFMSISLTILFELIIFIFNIKKINQQNFLYSLKYISLELFINELFIIIFYPVIKILCYKNKNNKDLIYKI